MAAASNGLAEHSVFLQQPDGSLVQATPDGYIEPQPCHTPLEVSVPLERALQYRARLLRAGFRARLGLVVLLTLGLVAEIAAAASHASSAARLRLAVRRAHPRGLGAWHPSDWETVATVLTAQAAFAVVFYSLGALAVVRGRPKLYRLFSKVAMWGAMVQPVVAVVSGSLSMVVMFHKFAAYAHSDVCVEEIAMAAVVQPLWHDAPENASSLTGLLRRMCPPRRTRNRMLQIHNGISSG